jgi:5-(carboxyamino)imidazole ribonucleotide mutase
MNSVKPVIGIIMGSKSDWETMKHAAQIAEELNLPHETKVVSAHRTPNLLFEYAESAEKRGIKVIIAAAGGAAHLPGMTASKTVLPVIGVPIQSSALNGIDSLLSIVQMPSGVPVGTMAIGRHGAINAVLFAAKILAAENSLLRERIKIYTANLEKSVLAHPDPSLDFSQESTVK